MNLVTIKGYGGRRIEVQTTIHGTRSREHHLYCGEIWLASTGDQPLEDAIDEANEKIKNWDIIPEDQR